MSVWGSRETQTGERSGRRSSTLPKSTILALHTGRGGGNKAVFQRINNAYATLSDREQRQQYDAGEDEWEEKDAPCDSDWNPSDSSSSSSSSEETDGDSDEEEGEPPINPGTFVFVCVDEEQVSDGSGLRWRKGRVGKREPFTEKVGHMYSIDWDDGKCGKVQLHPHLEQKEAGSGHVGQGIGTRSMMTHRTTVPRPRVHRAS